MNREKTNQVSLLALMDVSFFLGFIWLLVWDMADLYLPLSSKILFLGVMILFQRLVQHRLKVLSRLSRRIAAHLTFDQRRYRYRWICFETAILAAGIALVLPFGFGTAAFWCIYITIMMVVSALLNSAKEDLLQTV